MPGKKITISNFKGLTDHKNTKDHGYAQTQENLRISKDGGLETRPGSTFVDGTNKKIDPTGNARCDHLFEIGNDIIYGSVDDHLIKSDQTSVSALEQALLTDSVLDTDFTNWTTPAGWSATATTLEHDAATNNEAVSPAMTLVIGQQYALYLNVAHCYEYGLRINLTGFNNTIHYFEMWSHDQSGSGPSSVKEVQIGVFEATAVTGTVKVVSAAAAQMSCYLEEIYVVPLDILSSVADLANYACLQGCEEACITALPNERWVITGDNFNVPRLVFSDDRMYAGELAYIDLGLPAVNPAVLNWQCIESITGAPRRTINFKYDHGLVGGSLPLTLQIKEPDGTHYSSHSITAVPTTKSMTSATDIGADVGIGWLISKQVLSTDMAGAAYEYNFHLRYDYKINGISYSMRGPVSTTSLSTCNARSLDENGVTLIEFPQTDIDGDTTLDHITTPYYSCRDFVNYGLEMYRTEDAGSTNYRLSYQNTYDLDAGGDNAGIRVGTISPEGFSDGILWTDVLSDALIDDQAADLYIDGGILDNDQPPRCKYSTYTSNGILWFANSKNMDDVAYPYRIHQCKKDTPHGCPLTFITDVDETITGLSSIKEYPIVFTENSITRLEGYRDNYGNGTVSKRPISTTIGCVGNRAIVKTSQGIYFLDKGGFYVTDGASFKLISHGLEDTVKGIIATASLKSRIVGAYDDKYRRIYWACSNGIGGTENSRLLVYDIDHKAWHVEINDATNLDQFSPSALLVNNSNEVVRTNRLSYLFKHDEDTYTDPYYNVNLGVTNWQEQAIPITYRSVNLYFGDITNEKWIPSVTINAEYEANATLSLQLNSYDMDNPTAKALTPIRYIKYGDADFNGETHTLPSGIPTSLGSSSIKKTRHFPGAALRTEYKSIEIISPASTFLIYKSENYGTITTVYDLVNFSTTATLATGTWPTDIGGYNLVVDSSSYRIQTRDSGVQITVVGEISPDGSGYDWDITGTPKGEKLNLKGISFDIQIIGDMGGEYKAEKDSLGDS